MTEPDNNREWPCRFPNRKAAAQKVALGNSLPSVRVDSRLVHRIAVREWGLPSTRCPGKMWRSEDHGTISCMLAHPDNPMIVRIETRPLEIVDPGGSQWMPDDWRAALWEYCQAWPSSGCEYGPFLALTEERRCDFIRKMAEELVASDNIGCRLIAHDVGMFAAIDYELPEPPENVLPVASQPPTPQC